MERFWTIALCRCLQAPSHSRVCAQLSSSGQSAGFKLHTSPVMTIAEHGFRCDRTISVSILRYALGHRLCWKDHLHPNLSLVVEATRFSAKFARYIVESIMLLILSNVHGPLGLKRFQNITDPPYFTMGLSRSSFTSCHIMSCHVMSCHLVDAFIQSDLQLIRLSRRHTPWSNVGFRALLKGPTAAQILSWPHRGSHPL